MKRSMNEINGMILKAARGAGIPSGHCEDLAAAAAYIAATDPAALAIFPDVLAANHTTPTFNVDGDTMQISGPCVALSGPMAVDAIRAGFREVRLINVEAPIVVFALFATLNTAVAHRFDGADLLLTATDAPPSPPITHTTVTVSEQLWQKLNDYAAKTYVPASDASRLAGAGAGLTDND